VTSGDVTAKLAFARRRVDELLALNRGNLAGADPSYRQQLLQECLSHLAGAVELTAQLANEKRTLGLETEEVRISTVLKELRRRNASDALISLLSRWDVSTAGKAVPADPYSEEGYIFRIFNYRHQVAQRGTDAFAFATGSKDPEAALVVDPRDASRGHSSRTVRKDLEAMLQLVERDCMAMLSVL
jgi:hypothetical protein